MKCPKCGRSNPKGTWHCDCGYNFENPSIVTNSTENLSSISDIASIETISKRHKAIRIVSRIGNFVGWLLVISILFLPIGITLLYLGHLTLASLETEQNTRETVTLLQEILKKKS
jgi:hypothetical protein